MSSFLKLVKIGEFYKIRKNLSGHFETTGCAGAVSRLINMQQQMNLG